MKNKCTLLKRLGGEEAVNRICDAFYARVMLDDRVVSFFDGIDMNDLLIRQQKFMYCLLDDTKITDSSRLCRIHQRLVEKAGLSDLHFDAMKELLGSAMNDAGIDAVLANHVLNRMETTRIFILGSHNEKKESTMFARILSLVYGFGSYIIGMASLVYIGLWLINLLVPNALDAPAIVSTGTAVAINIGLIIIFALQHSGMARPAFKKRLTRHFPEHLERSTYVLVSGVAVIALCYLWQPMGGIVWEATGQTTVVVAYTVYALGWALLVLSTFWINHFDLFGLRQVWMNFREQPYVHVPFKTPGLYRYVRHPLYIGWFMVMWATPLMTVSHLVFAIMSTIYILIAIQWEESDLEQALPEYRRYKAVTPMLFPQIGSKPVTMSTVGSDA
jgi:methanethiol S-methyltransferase